MHMCTACNVFLVFRPTTRKSDQLMNEIISTMQEGLQNSNREFLKRTRTHADLEMSRGKKRMLDVQAASLDVKVEIPQRDSEEPSVDEVTTENCSRAYASLAKDRTVRADVFKTQFIRTVAFTNWQEDDSGDVSVKQIADYLSDGCRAQYKNRKEFGHVAEGVLGLIISHHFAQTAHFKGLHDGIGAVVKQRARRAELNEEKRMVDSASLFEFLSEKLSVKCFDDDVLPDRATGEARSKDPRIKGYKFWFVGATEIPRNKEHPV